MANNRRTYIHIKKYPKWLSKKTGIIKVIEPLKKGDITISMS
jgi:hypothetical protein